MHWKAQVQRLEIEEHFDVAIFLLEKVIKARPNDMDAYIFLMYRLMDTLVEGSCYWANVSRTDLRKIKSNYYSSKHDIYWALLRNYFTTALSKFHANADFLYYAAHIATFAPWYAGINEHDHEIIKGMFEKSKHLNPDNPLLKGGYEDDFLMAPTHNKEELITYVNNVIKENTQILGNMGSLGEYLLELKKSVMHNVLTKINTTD